MTTLLLTLRLVEVRPCLFRGPVVVLPRVTTNRSEHHCLDHFRSEIARLALRGLRQRGNLRTKLCFIPHPQRAGWAGMTASERPCLRLAHKHTASELSVEHCDEGKDWRSKRKRRMTTHFFLQLKARGLKAKAFFCRKNFGTPVPGGRVVGLLHKVTNRSQPFLHRTVDDDISRDQIQLGPVWDRNVTALLGMAAYIFRLISVSSISIAIRCFSACVSIVVHSSCIECATPLATEPVSVGVVALCYCLLMGSILGGCRSMDRFH